MRQCPIMKTVLIISNQFFPAGGVGGLRTSKFARYLPEYGWRPVVLSSTCLDTPADPSLYEGVIGEVPIYRTDSWDPLEPKLALPGMPIHTVPERLRATLQRFRIATWQQRWMHWAGRVLMPDRKLAWWPAAVALGRRLITRLGVQMLYATTPPASNVLVAWALKRLSGCPLVLDFRDPWCASNRRSRRRRLHKRLEPGLERRGVQAAGACVAVNHEIAAALDGLRRPTQIHSRVIPNGYDPLDVRDAARSARAHRRPGTYCIVHTGKVAFMESLDVLTRFLEVCERWRRGRPDVQLEVVLAGPCRVHETTGQGLPVRVRRFAPWARYLGVVSYRESLWWQQRADALLLFSDRKQLSRYDSIRSKCFEYAATGQPVLALVPAGSMAAGFVEQHGFGVTADPERREQIGACLDQLASGQVEGADLDEPWLTRFSRRVLAGQLAEVLDAACAQPHSRRWRQFRRAS